MGMYDSVYIDIKCPYCDDISERECQTKDLKRELIKFKKASKISKQYYDLKYINCITHCESLECIAYLKKKQENPYGRFFNLKIKLNHRIITEEYTYINLPISTILKKL